MYRLAEVPSGFFADEASIGFNAYSVLATGKDEYRKSFPFFFRSLDDYKGPVYIYSAIPFIYIFGLNEFSTRLPAALYGTGTIIFIYLLTKKLLNANKHKKEMAVFSSFFLAISPWHVHISRIAFEQSPFVFFTTAGLYFFIKSRVNLKLLFLSILLFATAFYSYSAAKIFIAVFMSLLFMIYDKTFLKTKRIIFLCALLALFSLLPFIYNLFASPILSRWQQVSIFSQPPQDHTIVSHILNNYLSHFSLDFLFLKGDIDMPGQFIARHSVRGLGEMHLFQLPLLILGFIYLSFKPEKRLISTLMLWLILYPVGSMFTIAESAQATRSIVGVVPFQIISAVGLFYIFSFLSRIRKLFNRIITLGILIIIVFSSIYYLHLYFTKYPLYSSDYWGWQYGYRSILEEFKKQEGQYDQLLITHRFNRGEELLNFYNVSHDCKKCVVMTNPISIDSYKRQLFALRQDDIAEAKTLYDDFLFIKQKNIYIPNGNAEIFIGKFVKH